MNIDKMREEFEAWYLGKFCGGIERLRKCSNDESTYYYCGVQALWVPWQASRESLVIELPKPESADGITPLLMLDIKETIAAIEAAGLKVKP